MNQGTNLDSDKEKSPQLVQSDLQPGVTKGFTVSTQDPWMMGRILVAAYGIQGDYPQMDIESLRWTEPMWGSAGSFTPPHLGGRVWVNFEGGDKYTMMYQGRWNATPMGDGTLPWNKSVGSDTRPEAWRSRNLVPESLVAISSPEGNTIWVETQFISKKYLASSLNLKDTSGKFFRIQSVHDSAKPYTPVDSFPVGEGALYQADFGEFAATRQGYEQLESLECVTGAVEFGHQAIQRKMYSFKSSASINQTVQNDQNSNANLVNQDIAAVVRQRRIKTNTQTATANANYFSSMLCASVLQAPRVW